MEVTTMNKRERGTDLMPTLSKIPVGKKSTAIVNEANFSNQVILSKHGKKTGGAADIT